MISRQGFKIFIIFIIISACSSYSRIGRRDLSFLYNPVQHILHPGFVVYHKSDVKSTLYFIISKSELLFARPGNGKNYKGGIKLTYKLQTDYGVKEVIDSASVVIVDSSGNKNISVIIDSIDFKASYQNIYVLDVSVVDLNKKTPFETYIKIDKTNQFDNQNFLIRAAYGFPAFKNYFSSNEQFSLDINTDKRKKILVKHFNTNFPPAAPPFSEAKEGVIRLKPDSIFILDFKNGHTNKLRFIRQGIYYFQLDTAVKKGVAIFRYNNDFPEINNTLAMLYPLRYLTTKNEYDKMIFAKDKKFEVDNFWLDIAGNPDRAKQLIRKYYNRVTEANILFSSYIEGWKTDRGIIYIIYGEPNTVYKTGDLETWYYGTPLNIKSIEFDFYKLNNPFSDNDFSLVRSANYKSSWYTTIENWRR